MPPRGSYFHGPKGTLERGLSHILFVEGLDDAYLMDALLAEVGADPERVGVIYVNGESNIPREIDQLVKSPAYVRRQTMKIGILRDGDDDPIAKEAEIIATLAENNIPETKHDEINVFDQDRAVGVYIIPGLAKAGAIEELLLATVADDPRLEMAQGLLDAVEARDGELWRKPKRLMRIYISLRQIKSCGAGRAYGKGIFSKDHPDLDALRGFLGRIVAS